MSEAVIHVELRETIGKQGSKALRREGKIPAIFYTHDEDSIPVTVDAKALQRLMQQEINIIDIQFPDGKSKKSIVRELQRDPVTDNPIHVDFMGVKLTEKIRITIPIVLIGAPIGVKEGGILEHILRDVEVEGLPLEIPEHISVDISNMQIGDVVTLEDVEVDKARIVTEIHHAIAHVVQPKVSKALEEEEAIEEEVEEEAGEEKPSDESESE